MDKVTFDSLPEVVALLVAKLNSIEALLKQPKDEITRDSEQIFGVQGAAEFLGLTVPTIYSKVNRRELPAMKRGNRLYFSKSELTNYLKAGRLRTFEDIDNESSNYITDSDQKTN